MRPMLLLVKSWVRPHTRRLPDGRVVQVAGHQDRRTRQPEANPHQLDLDLENANNPAGPRSSPNSVGSPPQDPQLAALLKQYAGDSEVTPEEIHEAVRQHRDVEARYRGTPQWLKAPNGLPTGLNERQWVLVRTPNFKRWFGNWRYDPDAPVAVVEAKPGDLGDIDPTDTAAVRAWLLGSDDFAVSALNADTGLSIAFSRENLRASLKRRGAAHRQAYTALRAMIETGVWVDHVPADRPGLAGQDVYQSALRMPNGALYGVRIKADVRHDRSTAYKDHRLTEVVTQIEVTPAAFQGSREGIGYPVHTGPAQSSVTVRIGDLLGQDKPEASKVVDPNGEPLVVYHGTAADFESFDNAKTGANDRGLWGRGHYWAANAESANSYALRQGDEARVIPAYVSIKNPLIMKTGEDLVTRLPDGTNYKDLVGQNLDGKKIKDIALSGGHDGVIQIRPNGMIGDVVAFSPTQIKSAIGNAGTFRPDLGHINKAHRPFFLFFRGHG